MTGRGWRAPPWRAATVLLLCAAGVVVPALARSGGRPAVRAEGYTTHQVAAGDTLAGIGARYLAEPAQWHALQRLNGIADPEHLVPGSTVRIPARLLKPSALEARVEFVRGDAVAQQARAAGSPEQRSGGEARPGAPAAELPLTAGASLPEGAHIQVPQGGYLRLRLADGSIVRVLAGSDVELRRLRRRNGATSFESIVNVRKGKVESEVSKQPRGRVFEIHAPGAVASVRGTVFDVAVDAAGRVRTAVTEGTVVLRSAAGERVVQDRVGAGRGVVIGHGGRIGRQQVLPPAPDLSALPDTYGDAGRLALDLGPAARGSYEVRVAREPAFREVLRDGLAREGRLQFAPLAQGRYTVGVRALDANGLAGPEAQRDIRIQAPSGRTAGDGAPGAQP